MKKLIVLFVLLSSVSVWSDNPIISGVGGQPCSDLVALDKAKQQNRPPFFTKTMEASPPYNLMIDRFYDWALGFISAKTYHEKITRRPVKYIKNQILTFCQKNPDVLLYKSVKSWTGKSTD